jgi:hypothetical protein
MIFSRRNVSCSGVFIFLIILCQSGYGQIDVSETNSLTFGDVFPGIPKQVTKYIPGAAAEFLVTGTAGAELTVDFTLPTYLSSGGNQMQIIFREDDCAMDSSASYDQTSPGYDNIDPWHQITYRLGSSGLRIWLGAEVVPMIQQPKGNYTASIVVTVQYTGN